MKKIQTIINTRPFYLYQLNQNSKTLYLLSTFQTFVNYLTSLYELAHISRSRLSILIILSTIKSKICSNYLNFRAINIIDFVFVIVFIFVILKIIIKINDLVDYFKWDREITKLLKWIRLWKYTQQNKLVDIIDLKSNKWNENSNLCCIVLRVVVDDDFYHDIKNFIIAKKIRKKNYRDLQTQKFQCFYNYLRQIRNHQNF